MQITERRQRRLFNVLHIETFSHITRNRNPEVYLIVGVLPCSFTSTELHHVYFPGNFLIFSENLF